MPYKTVDRGINTFLTKDHCAIQDIVAPAQNRSRNISPPRQLNKPGRSPHWWLRDPPPKPGLVLVAEILQPGGQVSASW